MLELHEHGIVVITQIVLGKTSNLCRIFRAKSDGAKTLIVYRWLKTQGLSCQMSPNECEKQR